MTAKLITLEGIEGAGKSTQLPIIAQLLQQHGRQVLTTREPGGTKLGEKIRSLLLSNDIPQMANETELLLLFAARAEHLAKVVKPALEKGTWVICDRFIDATYAYQGGGRGVDEQKITQLTDWTLNDLSPDLTLLFDLPVEKSMERMKKRTPDRDRFEQEQYVFFEHIRQAYLNIAHRDPNRVKIIDAQQTESAITEQLHLILANNGYL